MNERKIVAAVLKDRKAWERIKEHATDLSPEGVLLTRLAGEYYIKDPTSGSCDLEIVKSQIERNVTSNKLIKVLHGMLDQLPDVSSVNIADEMLAMKRHVVGQKLASALSAGRRSEEIDELIKTYQGMLGAATNEDSPGESSIVQGVPVEALFKTTYAEQNLIKVLPKALNERLDGGVLPGHHLVIFAPTEMGKTLLAINMVAGFLKQKLGVLYIGNEDPAEDVLLRLGTRLSGLNKYEIRDNPQAAQKLIDDRAGNLFTIAPLAPGTFEQIGALVRKYGPKVVILDQLRNLDVKSDNRTQALEKAATEARNLAKRHGLVVVSIVQAGDSASGRRVLGRGDVDSSNVGIPGQADVMIGFGATEDDEARNIRWISLPKNKRGGNHEPFQVFIDPQLSKVLEAA
jgi:archaellum biogenesis ATPase FlaH